MGYQQTTLDCNSPFSLSLSLPWLLSLPLQHIGYINPYNTIIFCNLRHHCNWILASLDLASRPFQQHTRTRTPPWFVSLFCLLAPRCPSMSSGDPLRWLYHPHKVSSVVLVSVTKEGTNEHCQRTLHIPPSLRRASTLCIHLTSSPKFSSQFIKGLLWVAVRQISPGHQLSPTQESLCSAIFYLYRSCKCSVKSVAPNNLPGEQQGRCKYESTASKFPGQILNYLFSC